MRRARSRNAARQNFAALRDIVRQQLHVLEIYDVNFVQTETTDFAAAKSTTRAATTAAASTTAASAAETASATVIIISEITFTITIKISRHNFPLLNSPDILPVGRPRRAKSQTSLATRRRAGRAAKNSRPRPCAARDKRERVRRLRHLRRQQRQQARRLPRLRRRHCHRVPRLFQDACLPCARAVL